jgi:hypothetical protein
MTDILEARDAKFRELVEAKHWMLNQMIRARRARGEVWFPERSVEYLLDEEEWQYLEKRAAEALAADPPNPDLANAISQVLKLECELLEIG